MKEEFFTGSLPVLALRGLAVYPEQTIHFDIGRIKSVLALEAAMKRDQVLMLAPQKDLLVEDPKFKDLYTIGTVVRVKQILKPQGDNIRILVQGLHRARLTALEEDGLYLRGEIEPVEDSVWTADLRTTALCREANDLFSTYLNYGDHSVQGLRLRLASSKDCGFIADSIAQQCNFDYRDKIKVLCQLNPVKRLEMVIKMLRQEVLLVQLESDIQEKTRAYIDQDQRDYYLREQMKVIREELGEGDEHSEFAEYEKKILLMHLPTESEQKVLKDLERLKKQPFGSAEASVLRNFLDTLVELPINKYTKERADINAARKVLDKDHFGLEKVKQRILETIAVRQMAPEMPPQIICLVGPPGVGKTSIAFSVAKCLNRKMARIALGGVHDEADIRGHRKTYVGAMPGRIVTAMIQAQTMNPVLLLDEVDKMGSDYRGDPSAALLEVLDSEQNKTYRDHFLEIPFDLSKVLFITTANTLDTIPRPLLDRMEIIELGSYTDEEKMMIGKNHLIAKQLEKHGLKKSQVRITDDAVREIITCYTRESGVRTLERNIAQICRKIAVKLLQPEHHGRITVSERNIEEYLGVRKYVPDILRKEDQIGMVTGLAWTSVGGATLEVEVNVMDGTGKLELTGNLGDVMKESAQAALSYIRANTNKLQIAPDFYKTKDIHVHFPEGAVPKDGPSAGVTVCTAIVSALTGRTVRADVAMTGEISLRGRVLPIGGLKEKTMAALRHGISTVVIPKDNERDLEEIDQTIRNALTFVTAETVDTVLSVALNHHEGESAFLHQDLVLDVNNKGYNPSIQQ